MFKIGDEVFCEEWGTGKVVDIDKQPPVAFPIWVLFDKLNYDKSFNRSGFYCSEKDPTQRITKVEKPMQVTRSEVFSELARVSLLAEQYNIPIKSLWKCNGNHYDALIIDEEISKSEYTFALAIIAGKPVFAGDKLWHTGRDILVVIAGKGKTSGYLSVNNASYQSVGIDRLCWNKPKQTFILNGEELPLPDSVMPRENFNIFYFRDTFIERIKLFQWNESTDRTKVEAAILKLLNNDKEV